MYQQSSICCTLKYVPLTKSALQKSRLPFAIHLYPFGPEDNLPVLTEGLIVRCSICRTYINPYVRLNHQNDQSSWFCNLCNKENPLPPEFFYDYARQRYYDIGSKPELNSEAIEYTASVEYMVRPPQPSSYIFVFECSKSSVELGYIPIMASAMADTLDQIPGDARASIGFIAFDSNVHFFSFTGTQVVHYSNPDVDSVLIPCSIDGILVNMTTKREMILDFLNHTLPKFPFGTGPAQTNDTKSALGPAINAALKVINPIGGKISIILAQMPNHGGTNDGSVLQKRGTIFKKNFSSDKNGDYLTPLINPASDYYKQTALDCCEHQVSVDVFNLSTSYVDLASIDPLVKFCGGYVYHYANASNELKSTLVRFDQDFRNYLTRPLGLESVCRLRYSRGLKIHTFHGNYFVRSSNLMSLPIANPDTSYAFQISLEEDLDPCTAYVYFQSSILYTNPDGERRIRVHTARYPTARNLAEVVYNADQTAIIAILSKMAVDRSIQASIGEARDALIGAGVDLLEIYSMLDEMRARSYAMGLPENLRLVPLYILALLKHIAFRLDPAIKLDDRCAAMERFKCLPVDDLVTYIYPDLFPLHKMANDEKEDWKTPLSLTAAMIERNGVYLLDAYDVMILYVCEFIDPKWCYDVFGVQDFASIPANKHIYSFEQDNSVPKPRDLANFVTPANNPMGYPNNVQANDMSQNEAKLLSPEEISNTPLVDLPALETEASVKIRDFISFLVDLRPHKPRFYIIKDNSRAKAFFTQYLIDDRSEGHYSFAEFWRYLQDQAQKS